jgi:hypothetical protein
MVQASLVWRVIQNSFSRRSASVVVSMSMGRSDTKIPFGLGGGSEVGGGWGGGVEGEGEAARAERKWMDGGTTWGGSEAERKWMDGSAACRARMGA